MNLYGVFEILHHERRHNPRIQPGHQCYGALGRFRTFAFELLLGLFHVDGFEDVREGGQRHCADYQAHDFTKHAPEEVRDGFRVVLLV